MNRAARCRFGYALLIAAATGGCSHKAPSPAPGSGAASVQGANQSGAVSNDLQHVRFPKRDGAPLAPPGTTVFVDAFPAFVPGRGHLQHELLRQALMIAARDQMGLTTRDRTLRDSFPEKQRTPPLMGVAFQTVRPKTLVLTVFREGDTRPDVLWEGSQEAAAELTTEAFVTIAERLSRKELVEALGKAGYKSQARITPERSAALVPEPIDRLLDDLTFLPQYEAVRRLHAEISRSGESPALLSALARGYANLGAATEYLWSAAHKALKARALLYAERLVARNEQSPQALFTRGYVRGLIGRHAAALDDLERARKLTGRSGNAAGREPEPAWAAAIDAYCRFDKNRQEELAADEKLLPQIRYLQFLASAGATSERTRTRVAEAVLEVMPECWPAAHLLSNGAELDVRRRATMQVLARFPRTFYRRLSSVPDLPPDVTELCSRRSAPGDGGELDADDQAAEATDRWKVVQSLRRAGTLGEPSFGLLAHLVEDTGFTQVLALVTLERTLAVPSDESREIFEPLYAEHRFADYIESAGSGGGTADVLARAWNEIEAWKADLGYTALPMLRAMQRKEPVQANILSRACVGRVDPLFNDLTGVVPAAAKAQIAVPATLIGLLSEVSPHSPQAMVARINADWQSLEQQSRELEEKYADEPEVLDAIANRYEALRRRDDFIRCLRLEVDASPEYRTYLRLAGAYRQDGKLAEWRATLDEYLQTDQARGLEHAVVQAEIANNLMSQGDCEQALPYAVAAAETYAEWGLTCAHRCYDLLGDFDRAEAYIVAAAQRYESASLDWLEWCLLRGRGDVDAARQRTAQWLTRAEGQTSRDKLRKLLEYYLLIGDTDEALKTLTGFGPDKHLLEMLHAAFAADELGQAEQRDRFLQEIAGSPQGRGANPVGSVVLGRLMQEAFAAKAGPKFDVEALDKILQDAVQFPGLPTILQYFAGRLLLKYGPREKGIEYLQQSATSPEVTFTRSLAAIALRRENVDIGPTRRKE